MAFLRLKKKAIINKTNSRIANGKNNAGGTKVPAIVPTKAMANESAKVLMTDGKNSVDVCVYNFLHLENSLYLEYTKKRSRCFII